MPASIVESVLWSTTLNCKNARSFSPRFPSLPAILFGSLCLAGLLATSGCADAGVEDAATSPANDSTAAPVSNREGTAGDAETIDFELAALDGSLRKLSDWRNQWVVINYWATWCAP